jgi:hypothetical protein
MTTALGNRADVHAMTLRRVGRGDVVPVVPRTRQPGSTRSRSGPVHVVRVHPWAWQIALILANGDAHRITIEGETTVIVR